MIKAVCLSLLRMKTRYLLGLTLAFFAAMICAAFTMAGRDDFDLAKQEILLRDIGHKILLQSGDSTSRVMPIERVAENEYQIKFENEFTFQSDSLVKTINQSLERSNLSHNYIVNVLDNPGKKVIFGYAMLQEKKGNIIACSGRRQPKTSYIIDIKFKNTNTLTPQKGFLIGSIPLLAFIGLFISRTVKGRKNPGEAGPTENDSYQIGQTLFDPKNRQLINGDTTVELTSKENKLLLIFALSPNAVIKRARLQKEIWEDEGVIVGRSLDMFISKLRKKLEIDPRIQLVNIHGKGYKLEVNSL